MGDYCPLQHAMISGKAGKCITFGNFNSKIPRDKTAISHEAVLVQANTRMKAKWGPCAKATMDILRFNAQPWALDSIP